MSGSSDSGREDFSCNEESDGVGSELVEERREEIHGLECTNPLDRGEIGVVEGRDDEEDKITEKSDLHHAFATVEFEINQKGLVVLVL